MKYIDLTHTITDKMPSHPLDSIIELKSTAIYKEHGVANELLCGSVHMGTHIDAPGHFVENGKKIVDFSPEYFIGEAICIDVRNQFVIDVNVFKNVQLYSGLIVLFYTGWDSHFYKDDYFYKHPVLSKECAQYLIDTGIKMVGVDFPSVDNAPYAIHKLLLSHDILIIENLTNLQNLVDEKCNIMAFPLKVDAHGAPVRVVACVAQ